MLEQPAFELSESYRNNGNILLDRLFDANIAPRPNGSDMDAEMEALAEELRGEGALPYVILDRGHSAPLSGMAQLGWLSLTFGGESGA